MTGNLWQTGRRADARGVPNVKQRKETRGRGRPMCLACSSFLSPSFLSHTRATGFDNPPPQPSVRPSESRKPSLFTTHSHFHRVDRIESNRIEPPAATNETDQKNGDFPLPSSCPLRLPRCLVERAMFVALKQGSSPFSRFQLSLPFHSEPTASPSRSCG